MSPPHKKFQPSGKSKKPILILTAKLISHSGDSLLLFPIFITISLMDIDHLARHAWPIVIGMAATAIIVWLIKIVVRKDRPKGSYGKFYRKTDPYTFPSGHSARVFTIVGLSIFNAGALFVFILVWAFSVSISRFVLKLHYWNDIMVGSLLGLLIGIIFHWILHGVWWGLS